MAQSAFLGLAGLSIGAAVMTGLTLFMDPVAPQQTEQMSEKATASKPADASEQLAMAPSPREKPQRAPLPQATVLPPPAEPAAGPAIPPSPDDSAMVDATASSGESSADNLADNTVDARPQAEIAEPLRQYSALGDPPPAAPALADKRLEDATAWPSAPDRGADAPAWRRYAALAPEAAGRPRIVIVLDDMGLSEFRSDRAVALPRPLTMAILPYGPEPDSLVARARAAGHEVIVHLPMEPQNADKDPGPNALLTGLSTQELDRRIAVNLDRMNGYVGINNHMGSRFTASQRGMSRLMVALQGRGLLFLDSLTTGASVGHDMAVGQGVPTATRDIFLDNARNAAAIARQLAKVEALARERGYAIAIGHPYPETLNALSLWLPQLKAKGFELAPVSAVVAHRLTG